MDKNKNCSACNIKLDINNYMKDRTVCKDCYNKKKSDIEKVNNKVSEFENHRHVIIGPSNVGKTYYMLKVLQK